MRRAFSHGERAGFGSFDIAGAALEGGVVSLEWSGVREAMG
jgi:hypothetical protein